MDINALYNKVLSCMPVFDSADIDIQLNVHKCSTKEKNRLLWFVFLCSFLCMYTRFLSECTASTDDDDDEEEEEEEEAMSEIWAELLQEVVISTLLE